MFKRVTTSPDELKKSRVFERSYKLAKEALEIQSKNITKSALTLNHVPLFVFNYKVVLFETVAFWQSLKFYWRKFTRKLIPLSLLFLSVAPIGVMAQSKNSPYINVEASSIVEQDSPSIKAEIVVIEAPTFQKPLNGGISQRFSFYHPAIDIMSPYGTAIKSVAEGKVEKVGWEMGYGKTVIIDHNGQFKTRYAHLSEFGVKEGDTISKENIVGKVGLTGWTSGPHLHFEVFSNGKRINPQEILPK